jgi:hypothetical protein
MASRRLQIARSDIIVNRGSRRAAQASALEGSVRLNAWYVSQTAPLKLDKLVVV